MKLPSHVFCCCCCSVTQSCRTVLQPHGLQHARLPCPSAAPELVQTHVHRVGGHGWISVMPSNHLVVCRPLLLLPAIFPSLRVFSNELALHIRWPKYWSFSISPSNEHSGLISFDWLIGSPCSPRDSQQSSPAPQFKSVNSSALSFLHSPTLTSIHDCWKNHSSDCMDLCWQSNISAF